MEEKGFLHRAWWIYQAFEQVTANNRAREQHSRILESLDEARRVREFVEDPTPSQKLGWGRLGTLDDAASFNMLDYNGLYLGALEGRPLFYNGNGHLLTYGRTQSGKGRDIILPNLAHIANNSLVVADPKNGENAFASVTHRFRTLGIPCIPLNPWNLLKAGNFRLNPLQRLIDIAQAGKMMNQEPYRIAMVLVPNAKPGSDNAWVAEGAQELLALRMKYLAYTAPERCTLGELWHFVNASDEDIKGAFRTMMDCSIPGISGRAARMLSVFEEAPKQYETYRSAMGTALRVYEPGSELADATSGNDFNPGILKHKPHTVYLMVPETEIEAGSQWIALTVSYIMETVASTTGPVRTTFLIDEIANLPFMPIIPKALLLYGGLGIQLWAFCQGRNALTRAGYSKEFINIFEEQAAILQMWGIEDPSLIRDIELWSGKKTEAVRGVNNSGGAVPGVSFGISDQVRPVLQSEDIRSIGEGKQLLRVPGCPFLFRATRHQWDRVKPWAHQLRDPRELHTRPRGPRPPLSPGNG